MGGRGQWRKRRRLYGDVDGDTISHDGKPIDLARKMTPEAMEAGRVGKIGKMPDYMARWIAYDDQGQPLYDARMVSNDATDLLLEIYRYGRGSSYGMDQEVMYRAAAIVAAEESAGFKYLDPEYRRKLKRLADPETSQAEIDKTRDQRMTGTLTPKKRGKVRSTKLTAAEIDGREQLREINQHKHGGGKKHMYSTSLEERERKTEEMRQKVAASKPARQSNMFTSGEDSPLFSGTVKTETESHAFNPDEGTAAKQAKLFDNRPEFGQNKKRRTLLD